MSASLCFVVRFHRQHKLLHPLYCAIPLEQTGINKELDMESYMVVAKFKEGITPEEIREMIPAEQAKAKELEDMGAIGIIKIAMPKRTVFIEAFAGTELELTENIESLPMAKLWDWEIFVTTPPAGAMQK